MKKTPQIPLRRNPPQPPAIPQVETEKIDPMEVIAPTGQDPLAHAEKMDLSNIKISTPKQEEAPPLPEPAKVAAPEPPLIDKLVNDDLLTRILKKKGLDKPRTVDISLDLPGATEPLKLTVRKQEYEDYVWVMAVMERKFENDEDSSLMMTQGQRNQLVEHYVAARCVVKLDDEYIWDLLELREQIKLASPRWDGQNPLTIQDFHLSQMGINVYGLLRRIHPDALFLLAAQMKLAFSNEPEADDDEEKDEKKNPTQAT